MADTPCNQTTPQQRCRFRWNGDDHTACPRCGGTDIDPAQLPSPLTPKPRPGSVSPWRLFAFWEGIRPARVASIFYWQGALRPFKAWR